MAKTPFLAKDGIATPLDVAVGGSISLTTLNQKITSVYKNNSNVDLIGTSENNHFIGQYGGSMGKIQLRTPILVHNPTTGVEHNVYTEGFRPLVSDLTNKPLVSEDPTRLWINNYATPNSNTAPHEYADVVNLSTGINHGLQLATGYSADDTLLHFRSRSDNALSTNGRGLQKWHRIYHTGYKPTASDINALSLEDYAKDHMRFMSMIQPDKWSRLFRADQLAPRIAGGFKLNIYYTRGNVVVNNTFNITFGHNNSAMIITTGAHNYSNMKLRVTQLGPASPTIFVEAYDMSPAQPFASQPVYVTLNAIDAKITPYTDFVDGDLAYAVLAETTTERYTLKVNNDKLWHQGNQGTNSGLDADMVDGIHASSFLRNDTPNTTKNMLTTLGGITIDCKSSSDNGLHITRGGNYTGLDTETLDIWRDDNYARFDLIEDSSEPDDFLGGYVFTASQAGDAPSKIPLLTFNNNSITYKDKKMFHEGFMGHNSGLDADMLDGQHASAFATLAGNQTFSGDNSFSSTITADAGILIGRKGSGYSGVLGNTRTKTVGDSLDYKTYWSYDSVYNETTRLWYAERPTLGEKLVVDQGYHTKAFRVRAFKGDVTSGWADDSWTNILTVPMYESSGLKFHDHKVFHEGFRDVAMTEAQFEANRAINNEKYAASGFIHFGSHHVSTAGVDKSVNIGLSTWDSGKSLGAVNLIGLGKRSVSDTGLDKTSKTRYAVINVAGVTIELDQLYWTFTTNNYCIVKFPPAPDGTDTYNKVTGARVKHNTVTAAFAAVSNDVEVVINRVDLAGIEVFLEEVTPLNPFVYPKGSIQSSAPTMNGIPTIPGNRPVTYYAIYDGDTTSIGTGVNFYAATTEQQRVMLADPKNNMYFMNDGRLVQWRCRIRTIAGAGNGDFWNTVSTNNALEFKPNTTYINVFGTTPSETYTGSGTPNGSMDYYVSKYHPWHNEKTRYSDPGVFKAFSLKLNSAGNGIQTSASLTSLAVDGECYFLPICTVSRLNQGAYHPSFNPNGTASAVRNNKNVVAGDKWDTTNTPLTSVADCFNGPLRVNIPFTTPGRYDLTGSVTSVSEIPSGRYDGRFHDIIYSSGFGGVQHDLRLKAEGVTAIDFAEADLAAKYGSMRGNDKATWSFVHHRDLIQGSVEGDFASVTGNPTKFKLSHVQITKNRLRVGDIIYLNGKAYTIKTFEDASAAYSQGTVDRPIDVTDCTRVNIDAGWSIYTAPIGTVCTTFTDLTVGGTYTHIDVIGNPIHITTNPYLTNGWQGTWIPTIPRNGSQDFKFTHKALTSTYDRWYTKDNGTSWIQTPTELQNISNSYFGFDLPEWVSICAYQASTKSTHNTINEIVYGGDDGVGRVWATTHYNNDFSVFGESLTGKVFTNNSFNQKTDNATVTNIGMSTKGTLAVNSSVTFPITQHSPINLGVPDDVTSVGCKVLDSNIVVNDHAYKQYNYTELQYTPIVFVDVSGNVPVNFIKGTYYKIPLKSGLTTLGPPRLIKCIDDVTLSVTFDSLSVDSNGVYYDENYAPIPQIQSYHGPMDGWGDDSKQYITNDQGTKIDTNGKTVLIGTARLKYPIGWIKQP